MDLRKITVSKAESLRLLADELEELSPEDSKIFTCKGTMFVNAKGNHASLVSEIKSFCDRDHVYVYFIEIQDKDIDHVFDEYGKAKKNIDRALPRINAPSSTLYVGSSRTNLVSRIKQHLGFTESKRTYALHMIHVVPDLYFKVTVLQFRKIRPSLLQIYEDSLHEALKPMFGRRGAR
jgi:hypothetical protein